MKIAGFWRPLSDIASIFHHEGHEGHEGEEGEEGETSLFVLFVLFVVNSMPTINRRWSEGFLTSWVTRSVSDDCVELILHPPGAADLTPWGSEFHLLLAN